jgi:hypothetical protein
LIGRILTAVGRAEDTVLTAFTDGCSGLRDSLAGALSADQMLAGTTGSKP